MSDACVTLSKLRESGFGSVPSYDSRAPYSHVGIFIRGLCYPEELPFAYYYYSFIKLSLVSLTFGKTPFVSRLFFTVAVIIFWKNINKLSLNKSNRGG